MTEQLTKKEQIELEVALIKKEIGEFEYNEHDLDFQFNQVVYWALKIKLLAKKLLLMKERQEILKQVDEHTKKWNDINDNSVFGLKNVEDDGLVLQKRKHYPNRRKRYNFVPRQIELIRQSNKTNKELAKIIGCSASLICQIKNRNIYKKI